MHVSYFLSFTESGYSRRLHRARPCSRRCEVCSKWILHCIWRYRAHSWTRSYSHQVTTSFYMTYVFFFLSSLKWLDASGKVRIWDTTQKEHILKYEYTPFVGTIKDIAWTEDSKRIAVVGEGRDKWVCGSFCNKSTLNLSYICIYYLKELWLPPAV